LETTNKVTLNSRNLTFDEDTLYLACDGKQVKNLTLSFQPDIEQVRIGLLPGQTLNAGSKCNLTIDGYKGKLNDASMGSFYATSYVTHVGETKFVIP
jgi:hypothetical protein